MIHGQFHLVRRCVRARLPLGPRLVAFAAAERITSPPSVASATAERRICGIFVPASQGAEPRGARAERRSTRAGKSEWTGLRINGVGPAILGANSTPRAGEARQLHATRRGSVAALYWATHFFYSGGSHFGSCPPLYFVPGGRSCVLSNIFFPLWGNAIFHSPPLCSGVGGHTWSMGW